MLEQFYVKAHKAVERAQFKKAQIYTKISQRALVEVQVTLRGAEVGRHKSTKDREEVKRNL